MQWEHCALAGTTDKDACHSPAEHRASQECGGVHGVEYRCRSVDERIEVEGLCVVRQNENTNQEAEVGKTSGDKRLLRRMDSCRVGVIESNQKI